MKIQFKEYLIDSDFRMTVDYSIHSEPFENHSHKDFYELVFVISGSGIHYVCGERQTINHGDIFLIPPEMQHGYPEVKDLKIYNILFSKSFLKYFHYDLKNSAIYNLIFLSVNKKIQSIPHILTLEKAHLLEVDYLAKEIIEEQTAHNIGSKVFSLSNFLKLMLIITRYAQLKAKNSNANMNLENMNKLLVKLNKDYNKDWTIESMAYYVKMTPHNFRIKFKTLTNDSPIHYLIQLRLEKSLTYLSQPHYNISEIANKVGFVDSNYYSRAFKKEFKVSPREYKNIILC